MSASQSTIYERSCALCGCDISSRARQARYCGRLCASRVRLEQPEAKNCAYCGKDLGDPWKVKQKRYCNAKCRHLHVYKTPENISSRRAEILEKQCALCGRSFATQRQESKFCSLECSQVHVAQVQKDRATRATCNRCGVEFRPKNYRYTTYCSRECSFEAAAVSSAERKVSPIWIRECALCRESFCARRPNASYCSAHPKKEINRWRTKLHWKPVDAYRQPISKVCRECGRTFSVTRYLDRLFCSKECGDRHSSRNAHHVRRLRGGNYKAAVYLAWLIDRDRERCQICRRRVERTKSVPHPMAPTIDHITPLAKGGSHSPENVQLAHFYCNSMKCDRGGGQLRLL